MAFVALSTINTSSPSYKPASLTPGPHLVRLAGLDGIKPHQLHSPGAGRPPVPVLWMAVRLLSARLRCQRLDILCQHYPWFKALMR